MSSVDAFIVDAFSDHPFTGCPAAVCALPKWPSDALLQEITNEYNQSETAFFVPVPDGFELRWFTTSIGEIDLCGHATMAAAHVIFNHLGYIKDEIRFYTRFSGELTVQKKQEWLMLKLPSWQSQLLDKVPEFAVEGCGGFSPLECRVKREYMLVFENEDIIRSLKPDFKVLSKLDHWVCVTAPGKTCDFVSRFFCPGEPLEEDPVTGSAHSMLVPYWAERLGKKELLARQLSKRGGELSCVLSGDHVLLSGKARTFSQGKLFVDIDGP